jgi:hypothetical protein
MDVLIASVALVHGERIVTPGTFGISTASRD